MTLKLLFYFVALSILASCTGGGYSRSYIITDTTDEEVVSESAEKR